MAVNVKEAIIEILKGIQAPEKLCQDNCYYFSRDIERILKESGYSCKTAKGISKMAIVFKDFDFVFKIPFRGMGVDDDYEEDDDDWYEFDNAMETEPGGAQWNYCALEVSLGEDAKRAGLSKYIPEVTFVAQVNNYYVYEQAKAEVLDELCDTRTQTREGRRQTETFCETNKVWCFNSLWIEDFVREYGEEEFLSLSKFLNEFEIDDLHDGNLGYIHGKPVIIDYASFRDY
jgi:hypothetical protein